MEKLYSQALFLLERILLWVLVIIHIVITALYFRSVFATVNGVWIWLPLGISLLTLLATLGLIGFFYLCYSSLKTVRLKQSLIAIDQKLTQAKNRMERNLKDDRHQTNRLDRVLKDQRIRLRNLQDVGFSDYLMSVCTLSKGWYPLNIAGVVIAVGLLLIGSAVQGVIAFESIEIILRNGHQGEVLLVESSLQPTYTITPSHPVSTRTPKAKFLPTYTVIPTITLEKMKGGDCIPNHEREVALVREVIDGNTIRVEMNGESYEVLYTGVRAPGTNDQYAATAIARNRELVAGKTIVMVKDRLESDPYGRLYRYVVADSVFVNYEMVAEGLSTVEINRPDVACEDNLFQALMAAKSGRHGMWGARRNETVERPTLPPEPLPTPPAKACNCRLDYDCADFVTHKEAQTCYIACGGNNWSLLDRDRDGSACELLP